MNASNRGHDEIMDHYTPECPLCKGVLLPEKVEALTKENETLRWENDALKDTLNRMGFGSIVKKALK